MRTNSAGNTRCLAVDRRAAECQRMHGEAGLVPGFATASATLLRRVDRGDPRLHFDAVVQQDRLPGDQQLVVLLTERLPELLE